MNTYFCLHVESQTIKLIQKALCHSIESKMYAQCMVAANSCWSSGEDSDHSDDGLMLARSNAFFLGVPIHWTGLLDWTTGLEIYPKNAQLQPPKAIVSPHQKQCPSLGHQDIYLVQCNLSIVATPRHQTNCRGAL